MAVCKKPYMVGALAYGCGQCLPCRINHGRQWTWRQVLESYCYEHNCFVTLTYNLGSRPGNWALQPRDVQLWLKRIRKAISPATFRFFLCGEYDDNGNPHYHLSLFGVSGYQRFNGVLFGDHVERCWGLGFVYVAEFNEATAQYVCGYTTKKLRDRKNGLEWNYPEFARMSNRPGLGQPAVKILAADLLRSYQDWESGDVPNSVLVGKRSIGLGRYLLRELREAVGFTPEYIDGIKQDRSMETSIDLLSLFQNSEGSLTFKEAHAKSIAQKILQTEARYKIWQSKHPYQRKLR
ncbi:replication initiator protein [Microvirus D_HF4_329]|nr:replication initiator protein [Microvirus D_HF4_329]